jgi:hypothetical protein
LSNLQISCIIIVDTGDFYEDNRSKMGQ